MRNQTRSPHPGKAVSAELRGSLTLHRVTDPASPIQVPTLDAFRAARRALGDRVRTTPSWRSDFGRNLHASGISNNAPPQVILKLELFQHAGSFKPRGAFMVLDELDADARARGVTAVSAGNHAMAVAYAAKECGCSAIVAMPRTADLARIEACRAMGTEVRLTETVHEAFELASRIEQEEGRHFVHPFEGPRTALGTGTLMTEWADQLADQGVPELDVVVVPIGGGGLAAGVAAAARALWPRSEIIGVEPIGAASMTASLKSGSPQSIERVDTIADSLGAPYALPYSFELCQRFLDRVVTVDDDALCRALAVLFRDAKLAVEPAGAASTAALLGPLRDQVAGKTVGLIVCGANTNAASFAANLQRGMASLVDTRA